MSGGNPILALSEADLSKLIAAETHLGTTNLNYQMEPYMFKRKPEGVYLINPRKTWEKLLLAARAVAAIENPADVCAISSRPYGQRAVLKFASATRATAVAGRFTPGTFTNQIQKAFSEPRLLVVSDPQTDSQAIRESSYVNIPVIAFCNTSSPLKHVDIAIPCNNNGVFSIGLMWWMLAREVLRLRGTISRTTPWDVMPDLYFYRAPEDIEKDEMAQKATEVAKQDWKAPEPEWDEAPAPTAMGISQPTGMVDWMTPVEAAPAAAATTGTATGTLDVQGESWD